MWSGFGVNTMNTMFSTGRGSSQLHVTLPVSEARTSLSAETPSMSLVPALNSDRPQQNILKLFPSEYNKADALGQLSVGSRW